MTSYGGDDRVRWRRQWSRIGNRRRSRRRWRRRKEPEPAGQESTSRCFVAGPVSSSSPCRRLLSHSRIRDPERLRTGERRSSIRDTGRTHDSDPLSGSGLYRAITRLASERVKWFVEMMTPCIDRSWSNDAERAIDFLYLIPYTRDTARLTVISRAVKCDQQSWIVEWTESSK